MGGPESESTPPPGWPPVAPSPASNPAGVSLPGSALPPTPIRWPFALLAAAVVVAVVVVVIVVSSGGGQQTLTGDGFRTAYPAGWSVKPIQSGSQTDYLLGSGDSQPNDLGIPSAGKIGMTITLYSADSLEISLSTQLHRTVDLHDPLALVDAAVGTPTAAVGAALVAAPHATTLGGGTAGAITYQYTFNGVHDIQSDVVAIHGQQIAFIEVDSEPALVPQANKALNLTTTHWAW